MVIRISGPSCEAQLPPSISPSLPPTRPPSKFHNKLHYNDNQGREGRRMRGEIHATDPIGHTQASGTNNSLCIESIDYRTALMKAKCACWYAPKMNSSPGLGTC